MAVSVPPTITDEVLRYISQHWSVGAASHKTEAREMTGQVLPPWELSDAINPDTKRLPIARSSQFEQEKSNPTFRATMPNITAEASALPVIDSNSSPVASQSSVLTSLAQPTIKSIAEARFQQGASEKNIARLLHQAGLAAEILKESDFYLKVENEPYTPLYIERHSKELYLTHFLADSYGDKFIDAEMVFNISASGQLTLTQTATQNPFTGGESRYLDREFGKLFSKNLLDQGFAPAAQQALQAKSQVQLKQSNLTADTSTQLPISPDSSASIPPPPITQEDITSLTITPQQSAPLTDSSTQESTKHDAISVTQSNQKQLVPNCDSSTQKPYPAGSANSRLSKQNVPQPEQALQLSLFDNAFNAEKKDLHLPTTAPGATLKSRLETTSPRTTSGTVLDKHTNNQPSVAPPTTESPVSHTEQQSDRLISPMQIFQEFIDRLDKRTGEYLAKFQSSSPSLDTLRQWYKASRELGKPQKYLDRITSVGNDFKLGQPLPDKAFAVMQHDLQSHNERAHIITELDGLSDRDFLLLNQSITDYFNSAPSPPPTSAQVQQLQSAIAQLATKIEDLWTQHSQQTSSLNTSGKGIFRAWNQKYFEAVSAASKTLAQISTVLTQKEYKENQLIEWSKTVEVYQTWVNRPQTVAMNKIAEVFRLPQMQERLTNIEQTIQEQFQQRHLIDNQQQQRQQGIHR